MNNLLTDLKAVLTTTPQRLNTIAGTFSDDLLRRQPLPGEWSALECIVHLIDTERDIFPVRVKAILAGEDLKAFFPDEEGTKLSDDVSAIDLAKQFEAIRAESLKVIDTLTSDDLKREATHSEIGLITLEQLLHEWGGHDLMHTVQAERALMQPFIEGSGPWKPYFADHIAKPSES